ncbi:winged helix-turn-helix domain-containing protein [Tardiphaga sp. 841_E9_N1_2]|uniref:winged helix-turn-helix domain-containing protein n=1 Tax=Tardiphaga sp. 841_E9_N1_2 TaxID=3240762 RepID=UPI003F1E6394
MNFASYQLSVGWDEFARFQSVMMEKTEITGSRIFKFGPFQLRPATRILEEAGQRVVVGDRAFDILCVLVQNNNDVFTVADLKQAVWKNVHVEDGVIRVHISALRKILGNEFIKNIVGRGYQFSGEIAAQGGRTSSPDIFYRDKLSKPPNYPLRLIGRDQVVEQVLERLHDKRFVTIAGPGGVGKTTLSLVVSRHLSAKFDEAICFVDLSPLSDASLVTSTIASSLGLSVSSDDPTTNLLKFVRDKTLLLVIDNCEHVIEGTAPIVEQIHAAAPDVHILATSREPLRVAGEHLLRVGPLDAPRIDEQATVADIARFSAMELFVERAAAAGSAAPLQDGDAALIGDICRKLDGLPLAIELAAARCDTYGLPELHAVLDDRVKMLWKGRRTAPTRHQTLDALIDWSFTLLGPDERSVLSAISSFQGAFRIRAAQAVAAPLCGENCDFREVFQYLVTSSLVTVDNTGTEPRYRLLDATRAYAALKLEGAPFRYKTKQRYLDYLLRAVEEADSAWRNQSADAWIKAHGAYVYDVRSALAFAFSDAASEEDKLTGIRLVARSSTIWFQLSLTSEYLKRLQTALAALDKRNEVLHPERMSICISLGYVTWHTTGRPSEMIRYFSEASDIAERLQDTPSRLLALWGLWRATSIAGDESKALAIADLHAALVDPVANPHDYLTNLRMKALSLHWLGEQRKASAITQEMQARQPAIASGWPGILLDAKVTSDSLMSRVYWLHGKPNLALQAAEDAADYALEKKHILSYCYSLVTGICPVSMWIGDFEGARYYAERLIALASSYGYSHWGSFGTHYLRALDHLSGNLTNVPQPDRQAHRNPFISELLLTVCPDALSADDFAQLEGNDARWYAPELLRLQAERLADVAGREALLDRSLSLARHQGALSWELRTTVSKARLWASADRSVDAREMLSDVMSRFDEGFETRDLVEANDFLEQL